jgi:DNA invertase Pin-like site-specific DNA recombinase
MTHRYELPLVPRHGSTLNVLVVCRISGANQDPKSLDDQEARARQVVSDRFEGPINYKVLSSQGSGEYLDRKELTELENLLDSRRFDLLITEDLGRIARRTRAYDICEQAEDCGTRVLALNDAVDTGQNGWQTNAFFSVIRHEMYNRDTAARIRRSLRHRFMQGGVVQFVIFGYIKPDGAKNDADIRKDPAAEPVYDRWFRMLEEGASYGEVADWLNEQQIQPGPCARTSP